MSESEAPWQEALPDQLKKYLRVTQRREEPVDMTVIRTFIMALPDMDDSSLAAFAQYVYQRVDAELKRRRKERK